MGNLFYIDSDDKIEPLNKLDSDLSENEIEDLLFNHSQLITGEDLLIIGRQIATNTKKRLDLLGIDAEGRLFTVELKKNYAPREVISQVIDYASWIYSLPEYQIEKIAKEHFTKYELPYKNLSEAFKKRFGKELKIARRENHQCIIFAKEFGEDLTRQTDFLFEKTVPVSCIKFEIYRDKSGGRYFSIDKIVGEEFEEHVDRKKSKTIYTSKSYHKQIISGLTKLLEEKYGDWSSNLFIERMHPFKIYQSRDGSWTSSFVRWNNPNDDTVIELELAISPTTPDYKQGFWISFISQRSKELEEVIRSNVEISKFFKGWDNETKNHKPNFVRFIQLNEILPEKVEKISISEMDRITTIINKIFPK